MENSLKLPFLLFLLIGCAPMSKQNVIETLEKKYDQSFKIISSDFILGTGMNRISVSPVANDKIVFTVNHNPKNGNVSDYYPQSLWQFEADVYLRSILEEIGHPFALQTGIGADITCEPKNIPSFQEVLDNQKDKFSLNLSIHLFGEKNAETLGPLLALDAKLRALKLKKVGLTVRLYDISSLKNGRVGEEKFDFGVHSENTFESENKEHFLGLIKYRQDRSKGESPSAEELLKSVKESADYMRFDRF